MMQERCKDWWSLPLAKAKFHVQILLSHLGCLKSGAKIAPKLERLLADQNIDYTLPTDIKSTQKALK
eukprot:4648346-Ditylum_brightwellii.AAC.1